MSEAIKTLEASIKSLERKRDAYSKVAQESLVSFTEHNEAAMKISDSIAEIRTAIFHLQTKK